MITADSDGLIQEARMMMIIIIYEIYIAPYIICKKVTLRRLTINNSMDVKELHLKNR